VAGALTYALIQAAGGNPIQEFDLGLYVGALLGGALGVASVFFMASTVDAAYDDGQDVASPTASIDNFDGVKSDPDNPYSSPNR
jgi:hypothetical protein